MTRTRWATGLLLLALTGCGPAAPVSGDRATGIAPPTTEPTASGGDWTMPTGVFRSDKPATGPLELHIEPGRFRLYFLADGTPDLGYAADCVTDDPSTITCTERDGYQLVFAWSGTADAVQLTLPGAPANHRAVWEGEPWTRVR